MSEERQTRIARAMAWERAKGELRSIYHTFWNHDGSFEKAQEAFEAFIQQIEDEGLIE